MKKKYLLFLLIAASVSDVFGQAVLDQKEFGKSIVASFQKLDYAKVESYFDSSFAKRVPPDKLKAMWENAISFGGAYVKIDTVAVDVKPRYTNLVQTLEFEKNKIDLRIILNQSNKIQNLALVPHRTREKYELPSYFDSSKVIEKEVQIHSGEYTLPGTLSLPKTGKKFPVVILVHGSGPSDRDASVNATKMFKDIALGLATKGVAVLRYEKRSKVYSAKMLQLRNTITVKEETMDDVIAAVQTAKADPSIDSNAVFLLGHSLGAMLLPRIAKQIPGISGLFMVGVNARPLEDVLYDQSVIQYSKDSLTAKKKILLDTLKSQVAQVKNLNASSTDTTKTMLLRFPRMYWKDLNNYHQVEVTKEMKMPVYILQGERDFQVTMLDFDIWKKKLAEKKNVHFKAYPKLNHLFQEGEGKSTFDEYDRKGNVPKYVIDDLYNWMLPKKK